MVCGVSQPVVGEEQSVLYIRQALWISRFEQSHYVTSMVNLYTFLLMECMFFSQKFKFPIEKCAKKVLPTQQ